MGEKVSLTKDELELWRIRIYGAVADYIKMKSDHALFMLVVWIYEYLETFVVNNTKLTTNLKSVKDKFPQYHSAILLLFRLRTIIVHKPYSIDVQEVFNLMSFHEQIDDMLKQCGFQFNIMSYVHSAFTSEVQA